MVYGIETKKMEEEARKLALVALEELYCMNCFQLHDECHCVNKTNSPTQSESPSESQVVVWNEDQEQAEIQEEEDEELNEGDLKEEEFNIMGMIGSVFANVQKRLRRKWKKTTKTIWKKRKRKRWKLPQLLCPKKSKRL